MTEEFCYQASNELGDYHWPACWLPAQDAAALVGLLPLVLGHISEPQICEVGVWTGNITRFLAKYVKEHGGGRVFAIDTFDGGGDPTLSRHVEYPGQLLEYFIRNMERDGLLPYVTPVHGTSGDFCMFAENETIDLVFLDGDHRLPGFVRDVTNFWPKLKIGGVMCGHDLWNISYDEQWIWVSFHNGCHGISKAIQGLFGNRPVRLGDSFWWTQKGPA